MDRILAEAGTTRTAGQNCVEMLLGHERFVAELSAGAYFLLEDWARRWDHVLTCTLGPNRAIAREIFQGDRRYMLAIRTPCSGDFRLEAEEAAASIGLPLRWTDAGLEHLEKVLVDALNARNEVEDREGERRGGVEGGGNAG